MLAPFVRYVRRKRLVQPGDRVLVAVSGGVDSMVLLHLFRAAAPQLGIDVIAAHFDHAMRPGSAADAEWLAGVCEAWQIPLVSARSAAALYGENAARNARYAFLFDHADARSCNRIATAHHADDQIETVLFRILRGTGVRGLAGIPLRRGPVIRPLLRFRKAQLEAYASAEMIRFRADETNATEMYARNRIRKAVIPALQTVTPSAPDGVLAVARNAARAERAWNQIMKGVRRSIVVRRNADSVELARGILLEYDAEIRARVLRAELRRFGVPPDARASGAMVRFAERGRSGSALLLPAALQLERSYDMLRLVRKTEPGEEHGVVISEYGSGDAAATIGGVQWRISWTTSHAEHPRSATFAADQISWPLAVRGWRAGDRIRLHAGTKKLKKLFGEMRIPKHKRASVPVLADANGHILWVAGIARSIDARVQPHHNVLTVTIEHAEIS